MNIELVGSVNVSRRLANHKWWHRDPFNAQGAWVDLLLLANNRPMDVFLHGENIHLDRGQLGWSILNLAARWKRSQEWTSKILRDFAEDGMINLEVSKSRKTIITICNYDAFNPPKPGAELGADSVSVLTTEPGAEPVTNPRADSVRKGNRELEREGERPAPEISIPSNDEVGEFCGQFPGVPSLGIPATIPLGWWTGWLESRLRDPARFPRDWKRAIQLSLMSDFANCNSKLLVENGGWAVLKKNGAGAVNGKRMRWQIEKDLESAAEQIACHPRSSWPSGKPLPDDVRGEYDLLVAKKHGLEAELNGGVG